MGKPSVKRSGICRAPGSITRVERLFSWAAVVCAIVVLVDILACVRTYEGIREGDWLLLVPAGVFLALAALRRPLAPRLAMLGISVVLSWGVFELAAALAMPRGDRSFAWYVWPPHHQLRVDPREISGISGPGTFSTNSLGIRGREFGDDCYRVLCVGGSTTECLYLDDRRHWPALLEQELSASCPGIWVGNIGRSSLTARDHATLLRYAPEADTVDCWIVLCGVNDLGRHLAGAYEQASAETFERTFAYRRAGWSAPWQRPLYRNTLAFFLIDRTVKSLRVLWKTRAHTVVQDAEASWYAEARQKRQSAEKIDRLPPLATALAQYRDDLRAICALAAQKQKRLVLATQPTLWQTPMPSACEALCLGGWSADGRFYSAAALADGIRQLNEVMRLVAAENHVECVDLAREVSPSPQVLYDDCHFNDEGARQVAAVFGSAFAHPADARYALPGPRGPSRWASRAGTARR